MYSRRRRWGVALAAVLAASCWAAPETVKLPDDDQLLKTAQIGTDGPALLAYFRSRTVTAADRQRIETLIQQLGDPVYTVRERASADLVACGLPAIGPLRQAQADGDVEVARRAERCLERIERVPSAALSAAAARLIAHRKPAGAVGVLLAYLPLADDDAVADEVREAFAVMAVADGKPDPILVQALDDAAPLKRGAAAEALARSGLPSAVDVSRKALTDANADVRLRTALALVTRAKDKSAVPGMIGLLAELPQSSGWRIEDVLVRLAGADAPKVTLGEDAAVRQKCRDAWKEWWDKNGAAIDLAKLDAAPPMLGNTLLVLRDRNGGGKIVEVNTEKKEVWKIEGLALPTDAVVVGRDRVLIAEQNNMVSERDFAGKVIWSKQVSLPTAVQRLPNGNTFVVCRNQVVELDTRHNEVFTYQRQQGYDVCAAQKLRNGEAVVVTNSGQCIRLDAKGKEVPSKHFKVSTTGVAIGGIDVLPNNHILLTGRNGVAEYDGTSATPVWQATIRGPTSVQRLPNGNTLVASGQVAPPAAVELDRNGQTVWDYKAPDGFVVWRARRR
jgi:hypothetical protein